jgi:predicted ATPase
MLDQAIIRKLQDKNARIKSGQDVSSDFLKVVQTTNFRNFLPEGTIEFKSPVTAIVGRNGTGKSTVLFLAGSAYAPLPREGKSKTQGKTFNDFIPDTQKDKMPLKSQYGFTYADGNNHSYVWHERKEGDTKRKGDKEWDRRHKTPRKLRNTIFIGFEKTIANGLILADYYGLTKKQQQTRLDSIGKDPSKLIKIDSKIVSKINLITGKNYSQIERRIDGFSNVSEHCYGYIVDNQYSDIACGSGEIALIRMIDVIASAAGNSLILIDEPENGIHQIAQASFFEFLVNEALQKNHQIIFTTHSEFILEGLNSDSIILLDLIPGEGKISPENANRSIAFRAISNKLEPKVLALVEDNFAEIFLNEILEFDPGTRQQIKIKSSDTDGWQAMLKKEFPKAFSVFHFGIQSLIPVLVLDGDALPQIKVTTIDQEFGTYTRAQRFYNNSGQDLDAVVKRISSLSGTGASTKINFKSCFNHFLNSKRDPQGFIKLIADYVTHLNKYLLFLPGDSHPEILLCNWLSNVVTSENDIKRNIFSCIHRDKHSIFIAEFQNGNNPINRDTAKKKIERLESYRNGLKHTVIFQWVNDPSNDDYVSGVIQKFRELVD